MMDFRFHTIEELKQLNIQDGVDYKIQYLNRDYFNADTTVETTMAKAVVSDDNISFIVPDPYGMDRFINEVKVLES
jgi:hypothetical protein